MSPSTYGYDFQQVDTSLAVADQLASYRERSRGRAPNREATWQIGFTQPLGERSKPDVGLKAIFRRPGSVAATNTLPTRYALSTAEDPRRAADFRYDQQV